jgi:hypothetical protein
MYSIKQERNFKSHKKTSNNMHYRMIRHFSVNLAVVTLVTTLMLMPTHIFTSDRAWAAEWNANSGQEGNNFTPVQETTGPDWNTISKHRLVCQSWNEYREYCGSESPVHQYIRGTKHNH